MKKPKGIQIDFSRDARTKEQNDIIEWSYDAVKILKAEGYDCFVTKYFVTSPNDYPCSIQIIGKN